MKDKAYTFYISPYIVKESGLVNRTSLSIFAKVVSDQEDIFDKVTLYDEKGNKVLIEFPNIKRDYVEDSYFIEESAHGVIDNKDLKIFEKFIDSKELYVIFEKSNKYPIKLPYPVRNAILDNVDILPSLQGITKTGGRLNLLKMIEGYKSDSQVVKNLNFKFIKASIS